MSSISGEQVVIVENNIQIINQSGSLASGPTGGYVQIFYNTDSNCLAYRNDSIGTIDICNVTGTTGRTGHTGPIGNVSTFGSISASGTIDSSSGGFTSVRNGVGDYTITFDTARPDAFYSVTTGIECEVGDDDRLIVYCNKTSTSFDINITEQDNGTTPGVPVDNPFSFSIPVGNYSDIILNTGPTGPTGSSGNIGPTGSSGGIGPTGPTGVGGTRAVYSTEYFSTSFFTNNPFLSTTVSNSIASRIPFIGTTLATPTRINMILDTTAGTTSATMTLTNSTATVTYGTLVVVVNTTPSTYTMTGITGLPAASSLLLFRFGPTTTGTIRIYSMVLY